MELHLVVCIFRLRAHQMNIDAPSRVLTIPLQLSDTFQCTIALVKPINIRIPIHYRHLFTLMATLPQKYALLQNYPNPFNSETMLSFDSPAKEVVEVTVFNLLGQRVKTIFHGQVSEGINTVRWEGTDDQGRRVATGVYFARLKTPSVVCSIKMLYLK